MIELILKSPFLYLFSALFFYIVQSYLLKNVITTGIINLFVLVNISISVSIAYLIILYDLGYITQIDFWLNFGPYLLFLFGLLTGSLLVFKFLKQKKLSPLERDKIDFLCNQMLHPKIKTFFWILFIALVLFKVYYAYTLVTQYGSGDARLIFSKNIRVFDIIFGSIENIIFIMAIFYFIIDKKITGKLPLILLLGISFFGGSKGPIIYATLIYICLEAILKGRSVFSLRNIILFAGGIGSVVLIRSFWTGFFDWYGFIERLVGAGDVFHISYISGNSSSLIGFYDPLSYLLHPFTAIFGIRGYEYPLGSMLMGTMGWEVGPNGPNPQITILNIVLFGKDPFISMVITFLLGFYVYLFLFVGYKVLFSKRINILIKLVLFKLFYLSSLDSYLDIGYFQITIVKTLVFILIVFLYEFFCQINIKREPLENTLELKRSSS